MSTSISLIIKNDFYDRGDIRKVEEYLKKTVEQQKKYFGMSSDNAISYNIDVYDDEGFPIEYEFQFDNHFMDYWALLYNGFWCIETAFNYSQFFYGTDWLRRIFFDIVRSFGKKEAWFCTEYMSYNCSEYDIDQITFEDWLTFRRNDVYEYDPKNVDTKDYQLLYHDNYNEYFERIDSLNKAFVDCRIVSISRFDGRCFVEKNGEYYLMNPNDGNLSKLPEFDAISTEFNSMGFALFKGGKSSFFAKNCEQITPFVDSTFGWRWRTDKGDFSMEVYNRKTGEVVYCNY